MKKLLGYLVLFFLLLFSIDSKCQDVLSISETNIVLRFFPNAKENIKQLNDSTFTRIVKVGSLYKLSVFTKDGKLLKACSYKFRGNYVTKKFTSRNSSDLGPDFVTTTKKIKKLEPVSNNCLKQIYDSYQ
ncbi:MAG TPA: hypothetical protein VM935_17990 [Chitinophagaceae bacterium]|jgi:hypothetical protein|nr:hypothetical protein [Chitinophagaceae bacterium]